VRPALARQVERDDHRLAKLEAFAEPIGLAGDDTADNEVLRADSKPVARADAQPFGRAFGDPRLAGGRRARRAAASERERPKSGQLASTALSSTGVAAPPALAMACILKPGDSVP
jgi:hypothetical protein